MKEVKRPGLSWVWDRELSVGLVQWQELGTLPPEASVGRRAGNLHVVGDGL